MQMQVRSDFRAGTEFGVTIDRTVSRARAVRAPSARVQLVRCQAQEGRPRTHHRVRPQRAVGRSSGCRARESESSTRPTARAPSGPTRCIGIRAARRSTRAATWIGGGDASEVSAWLVIGRSGGCAGRVHLPSPSAKLLSPLVRTPPPRSRARRTRPTFSTPTLILRLLERVVVQLLARSHPLDGERSD
jgi:hypothetical protein